VFRLPVVSGSYHVKVGRGGAVGANYELLKMELSELNVFVRHHFQLYLGWYTFFLTVNFGAIGWFTSVILTGALKVSLPILFIAAFFVIQLVFSYLASVEVRNYFSDCCSRSVELLALLVEQPPDALVQPKSAIPVKVYVKVITLICYTLISFIFFWLSLTVVAIHLVPL
jgi:hypothetical protein